MEQEGWKDALMDRHLVLELLKEFFSIDQIGDFCFTCFTVWNKIRFSCNDIG